MQSNKDAARTIYERCGAKEKLTMIYAEEGNVDELVAAAGGKAGEQPNYTYLLQNLLMSNPPGALADSLDASWRCFRVLPPECSLRTQLKSPIL
jgi:hypothetical protein